MNFTQRIVIETTQQAWFASPAPGVWRKPLEREAKESGHTTSIVKYEAGSRFATHYHPFGEEILVLEGIFSDGKASISLCTIHKSKGLENKRIFFLNPELIPSKFATQPWQLLQESNLRYVGITRAIESLIYLPELDKD